MRSRGTFNRIDLNNSLFSYQPPIVFSCYIFKLSASSDRSLYNTSDTYIHMYVCGAVFASLNSRYMKVPMDDSRTRFQFRFQWLPWQWECPISLECHRFLSVNGMVFAASQVQLHFAAL